MADKAAVAVASPDTFPLVRDITLAFCRQVVVLDVEVLESAIAQGEAALAASPVLNPASPPQHAQSSRAS